MKRNLAHAMRKRMARTTLPYYSKVAKADKIRTMTRSEEKKWLDKDALRDIRERIIDVHRLLNFLGIAPVRDNAREIWALSPFRDETQTSFHIQKTDLRWYDFGQNTGGGPLELIAAVKQLDIYAAGRLALSEGLADVNISLPVSSRPALPKIRKQNGRSNEPLAKKFSLLPYLKPTHHEIGRRGISVATALKLGFGYLPASGKSALRNRIVFQIRGVQQIHGNLKSVLLSHIGRAVSDHQSETEGKWRVYRGFEKSKELYNIDRLFFDSESNRQLKQHGLIIVEGCFDVAKLFEAGIFNVVATMKAWLSPKQADLIKFIHAHMSLPRINIWYDQDNAGQYGTLKALELLQHSEIKAEINQINWDIAQNRRDPCQLSVQELKNLRFKAKI